MISFSKAIEYFRVGINIALVVLLYVISLIVLMIAIYFIASNSNYTQDTASKINIFYMLLNFVFVSKVFLLCYDAYKRN